MYRVSFFGARVFLVALFLITLTAVGFFSYTFDMVFPETTGVFRVSVADLEQNGTVPVLVRLYYPSALKSSPATTTPETIPWLPSGINAVGYSVFLKVPKFIGAPIISAALSRAIMKVSPNHPLVSAEDLTTLRQLGNVTVSNTEKLPVMVFSHGLGGMRTTYSYFCSDMASHGWVVAAVEHRDGSASVTITTDHGPIFYQQPEPKQDEFEFRNGQLNQRVQEVGSVLTILKELDSGEDTHCVLKDNHNGAIKLTQQASFKHRLDFSRAAMAGHSFGGATTLTAIHTLKSFKCAIAMDAWMLGLTKGMDRVASPIPLFLVNSEYFSWKSNDEAIAHKVQASQESRKLG
eukprot:Ihof_evm3s274 gene=Ihof_evmTU3s274